MSETLTTTVATCRSPTSSRSLMAQMLVSLLHERSPLTRQRDQAAGRPEVLLAVAALEQLWREEPVEGRPAGHDGQVAVVHPVGEHHQAQRYRLVVDRPDVLEADRGHLVEQGAVLRWVHLGEVPGQVDEVVE